jgi:hypothetical protein
VTELDILLEGRKRLRTSAPHITDAQFQAWAESSRQNSAEFALTLEGVVARYPRENAVTRHVVAVTDDPE